VFVILFFSFVSLISLLYSCVFREMNPRFARFCRPCAIRFLVDSTPHPRTLSFFGQPSNRVPRAPLLSCPSSKAFTCFQAFSLRWTPFPLKKYLPFLSRKFSPLVAGRAFLSSPARRFCPFFLGLPLPRSDLSSVVFLLVQT